MKPPSFVPYTVEIDGVSVTYNKYFNLRNISEFTSSLII
jgi:hypothetical protein